MLSTKRFKLLALITALAILAVAATAQEPEKKRKKKYSMRGGDPYVVFVPGQPLLVAAERGGSTLLLRYPELEVARKLEGVSDRKLDVIKNSHDGTWLAGLFEESRSSAEGALRVWKTTTGESYLLLDDASRAFQFHPTDNRLIVWQPKSGITQWALGEGDGKRVGPAITSVAVSWDQMRLSTDGRYVLIDGSCRGDKDYWDFCVYSLEDGLMVGGTKRLKGTEMMEKSLFDAYSPRRVENYAQFHEILVATKLDQPPDDSACRQVGVHRALCRDGAAVALIDTESSPTPSGGLAGMLRDRQVWPFPGRVVWAIRNTTEPVRGRFLNSCALSADGRWLAVGVQGKDVMLFDAEQLQSQSNFIFGSWQQPALVKQFEMP